MKNLLTVEEVSEILRVPVRTLYDWRLRRQGPPGFRVGAHVRYDLDDLEEWIEEQKERG